MISGWILTFMAMIACYYTVIKQMGSENLMLKFPHQSIISTSIIERLMEAIHLLRCWLSSVL